MGWNGSGVFTKTYSWVADAANGIKIRADRHDTNDTDFTNGINNCLTKDGQNSASADLPMGNNKHTGVGNATARNNYLAMGQFQDGGGKYVATTGSANTYVAALSPSITAYAAGQSFLVNINVTNTGASTLNCNAVGAIALVKAGALALEADELIAGRIYEVVYNGTAFEVQNPTAKPQIIMGAHATAFANEIPMNSETVAKTSGGDLNGTQFEFHYKYLWNNYADGQAAVNGGRGASAQADWDANKFIAAPDMRDYVPMGVSSAGSITTVGDVAGASTVTPTGSISINSFTQTTTTLAAHAHGMYYVAGGSRGQLFDITGQTAVAASTAMDNAGSGGSQSLTGSTTINSTSIVQKSIGVYWYLRA